MDAFLALGIDSRICTALGGLGYTEPTIIQQQAIPPLLQGRDVLGQAATGTGKTAAFAVPMLQQIAQIGPDASGLPRGLVLVPTRELAMQVSEATWRYGKEFGIRVVPVYGGQSLERQVRRIRQGADIIVATPGRATDLLERKLLDFSALRMLVLDEADEMLDMGFAEDLEKILALLPRERQTALFSATLAPRIASIADSHLKNPVRIRTHEDKDQSAPNIRQLAYLVDRAHKIPSLVRILDVERPAAALVFCRMRSDVDALTEALAAQGHQAEALHGGLSQENRDRVMRRFRSGATELLIATNVAARGIDVPHLSHVINFELPESPDDYLHRIGRTARAGRAGVALTLVDPRELRVLNRFEATLRIKVEVVHVPSVADLRQRQLDRTQAALREALGRTDLERFRTVLDSLAAEFGGAEVALAAIQLAHAASGADKEQIEIPTPRIERPARSFEQRPARKVYVRGRDQQAPPPRGGNREQAALHVGAGRRQGVRPGDLVGAIVNETGLHPKEIGSIVIADHHSIVDLPLDRIEAVAGALKGATIRGRRVPVSVAAAASRRPHPTRADRPPTRELERPRRKRS